MLNVSVQSETISGFLFEASSKSPIPNSLVNVTVTFNDSSKMKQHVYHGASNKF